MPAEDRKKIKKVLVIDDDRTFLGFLQSYVADRYPDLKVETCLNPMRGLAAVRPDLDLLLVDLEMPGLDGTKVLAYAISKGLCKSRIIILSGRDAEYLHQRIPLGTCLAVLNKYDPAQRAVLDMVFDALQRKSEDGSQSDPSPA